MPGHADGEQLSPERLDALDKLGYFTPGFKAAVHDLVDSKHALDQANAEQAKLTAELPALQEAVHGSRGENDRSSPGTGQVEHPEETDFEALQKRMSDPGAKLEDQIALAQAYVWTYPASPHESEAQQYLEQIAEENGRPAASREGRRGGSRCGPCEACSAGARPMI